MGRKSHTWAPLKNDEKWSIAKREFSFAALANRPPSASVLNEWSLLEWSSNGWFLYCYEWFPNTMGSQSY
jgi:hypothetical protein